MAPATNEPKPRALVVSPVTSTFILLPYSVGEDQRTAGRTAYGDTRGFQGGVVSHLVGDVGDRGSGRRGTASQVECNWTGQSAAADLEGDVCRGLMAPAVVFPPVTVLVIAVPVEPLEKLPINALAIWSPAPT